MSGETVSPDGFGRAEGKKQGEPGSGKVGPIRGLALSPEKEEDGRIQGGATGEQVVPEKRGMEVTVADSGEATGLEKEREPKGRDNTGGKEEERRDLKKSPSGTIESKKIEGGKATKRVSPEKKKSFVKDDAKTKPIDSATGAVSVPKGVVGTKDKTASVTTGGKLVGSDAPAKAKANGIATKIPWEEEGSKATLGATSTIIPGKGSGKISPSKESTPSSSSIADSQTTSNMMPTASESKSLASEIKTPASKPKETLPKGGGIEKSMESVLVKKSSKPAEETKSTPSRQEKKEASLTQKDMVSRAAAEDSRKWEKGKVESPILGELKTKSGSPRDKAAGKTVPSQKSPTVHQDTKNLESSTSSEISGTGTAKKSSVSQEKSQVTGKTGPSEAAGQKITPLEKSNEVAIQKTADKSTKSDASKKTSPKTSSKTPSPQSSAKGSSLKENPKKTSPQESTKKISPQGTAEKLSPQGTMQKTSPQIVPKKTLSLDTTKKDPPQEKSKASPSQDSSKMHRSQDERKKTPSPDERKKTTPQDTSKASFLHDASKKSPTQDTHKKKSPATSPGTSSKKSLQSSKESPAETKLPDSSRGEILPEAVARNTTKQSTEKAPKADTSTDKSSKIGYELKDPRIKKSPSSTKVPMSEGTVTTKNGTTTTDSSKSIQDISVGVGLQSTLKTGQPQVKKSPSNTSVSKVDKVDLTTKESQEKDKSIVLPLKKSDNVDSAPKGTKVKSPDSQSIQVQKDVMVKAAQPTPVPSQDPPARKVDSLVSKEIEATTKDRTSGKKLDTPMAVAEAKVNIASSEKKLPKEDKMEPHKPAEKKTTSPKQDTVELAKIQQPKPSVVEQKDKKVTTTISQDAHLLESNRIKPNSSIMDKKKTIPVDEKPETSKNGQEKRSSKSSPPPQISDQHKPISPKSSVNGRTKADVKESKGKDVQVVVTPTEHKTIVQKLQEARQEAILVRGTPDMRQHSKSEMILPAVSHIIHVPSDADKHVTSSPNIKVQTPTSQKTLGVKVGPIPKVAKTSVDFKEISRSEAILPAVAVLDRSKASEPEKQITSSPNLSASHGRSAEGLPKSDSMARSSPSVAAVNGLHRALSKTSTERVDTRKGSIISDTMASPDSGGQAGSRARSATWSQAVAPQASFSQKDSEYPSAAPASATIADPEWDKRWSSAGSDILHEATNGRRNQGKKSIGPVAHPTIGTGKEWRSEGLAKGTGSNGVAPSGQKNPWGESPWRSEIGDRRGVGSMGPAEGVLKGLESELGMKGHGPRSHGFAKFDFQGAADTRPLISTADGRISWDRKDLVSPSSSTASKGSGIEKNSEASGSSYHSAASSTHVTGRRNSRSESFSTATGTSTAALKEPSAVQMHMVVVEVEDKQATDDGGDTVKLIDEIMKGEGGRESESGATKVECLVTVERKNGGRGGGRGGSGKKRGARGGHGGGGGVENRGADLEKALQEEEEAAAAARGDSGGQRPLAELWESDDKFSVANSQLPLTPAGEEDRGSIGSMLTTEPERGNWTGRFDFLLSLLGYSVGLGNVWRFPYLCYNNGGGAFLIPFTIMLIIAGLPLMFMELSFGQYANLGPAAIYAKFCPLFHGLGYGMVIVSTIVMLYYNVIIAWTIFYMFASFNKQLPWQNCEAEWSTQDCFSYEIADECMYSNGTYYQRTCYNETEAAIYNITHLAEIAEKRPPAEEYFNNYVLGLSKGIEEPGGIRLSMALCLLFAWIIVFLCLSKGVQSSGKVVYFTALFPYVVLIILFIRGVTLPGASTGIVFYLTPDWKRLSNAQVWGDAAVQIFFALSPAWGGLITLASYNKFSNNCYKDSLIVAVSNILTSFFAGFVIFSVIGFLAHELKVEVKKVVDQGAGLAFIVYPEVVTRLPVSPLWSLLFFVMLLTLGLDSQFALMETVTTAILDRFPNLREKKVWVVLVVAVLGYFGGLIFTTNSGMYWLQLMDKYAANWSVLLIAISECILIAWVYGADRFLRDVQEMIGPQSRLWMFFWCWMWKLVTPAALLFILFFNWVEYAPASYGEYIYPLWADAAGWVIGVFPVLVIVVVGIVKVCRAPPAPLKEKFKKLLQPTPDWGPSIKRSSAQPTYDSIRNTIVLMNGLPVIQETHADAESQEDNTL